MPVSPLRLLIYATLTLWVLAYLAIWRFGPVSLNDAVAMWVFTIIGIGGASIANSTGTGGGVVFVPAFSMVGQAGGVPLTTGDIVAMSILIQCFGMTVGSLTWARRLFGPNPSPLGIPAKDYRDILIIVLAGTIPALWMTQGLARIDAGQLLTLFKSFSIVLGVALLASLFRKRERGPRHTGLMRPDRYALFGLGALGGVATALFSVGVGEFVALYLLIRGYSLNVSVASAVMITAITVIAAAPASIVLHDVHWPLVAMAVPGVALGGFLGRRIAHALGTARLKLLASLWIIGSSLYLILR